MQRRSFLAMSFLLAPASLACAQAPVPAPDANPQGAWRSAAGGAAATSPGTPMANPPAAAAPAAPPMAPAGISPASLTPTPGPIPAAMPGPVAAPAGPRSGGARVMPGPETLPNEQGQVWRVYDISPYTLRVTATNRPEQAIVDWILRETGYETWHSEPLAILSATSRILRVYHTPQVQAVVAEIVDRFVNSEAEPQAFHVQVMTVDSPSWRVRVQRLLIPVQVQTPGVQAWLLEREAAAQLLGDLRRRGDFREHSSPNQMVVHGQSAHVNAVQGREYVRNIFLRPEVWPGFQPESAVVDEGFQLEFSPLASVDGRMTDAIVKCNIDQVEKMVPVMVDVPTVAAPRQQAKVEVPQMSHFRFHERFRWPTDKVLLISMGVVPYPIPGGQKGLTQGIPLLSSLPRADLLVLAENKGRLGSQPQVTRSTRPEAPAYRAR
jgi:hypothetical protein